MLFLRANSSGKIARKYSLEIHFLNPALLLYSTLGYLWSKSKQEGKFLLRGKISRPFGARPKVNSRGSEREREGEFEKRREEKTPYASSLFISNFVCGTRSYQSAVLLWVGACHRTPKKCQPMVSKLVCKHLLEFNFADKNCPPPKI